MIVNSFILDNIYINIIYSWIHPYVYIHLYKWKSSTYANSLSRNTTWRTGGFSPGAMSDNRSKQDTGKAVWASVSPCSQNWLKVIQPCVSNWQFYLNTFTHKHDCLFKRKSRQRVVTATANKVEILHMNRWSFCLYSTQPRKCTKGQWPQWHQRWLHA